ncbi:NAD(P)/FAD-dependent oxidoreductase [Desulfohalobiaceae bacterium Ax17]|jgi:NAD(P)H-nitrite reductase large subunit|uniref:NAD(P)/FAD-dependent oxidoreductase n=1 Tax=Desulfovulcanus ferrireducens TaxID=2831190 RepID=UPI00207BBD47|nr:FAD-dependent oxidoreductase [Desulfovulcanus ferrireducens]MBT8763612.1 NAD(P)/FAD-dependent oxidoreductase [Desulfovulcanus ferrireducens]
MKYVIVGNGVASIGAIEGIRRVDPEGPITVISEEEFKTYGRPLISYFLAGKVTGERVNLRDDSFYQDNKVDLKLGQRVSRVDPEKKTIYLENEEKIDFDKLLLATGGAPFCPPIPGADGQDIYFFTTLEHAQTLDGICKKLKRVVVIGGGLIGLKAAESLFDRGVEVSIVELAPRILSAAFDDVAGNIVANRLKKLGFNIFCNTTAKEIKRETDGRVKGVLLQDGEFLEADAVVIAIGVVPNVSLAKEAGINVNRGIVVDEKLMTSAPDVYAAGDVAEALDFLWKEPRVTPIWPNAYAQGFIAGQNMAGVDREYAGGLAMNSIGFYGLPTISVGIANPPEEQGYEVLTFVDEEKEVYRKLVFKDDKLVGCVLVGDVDKAGRYTGYIRLQIPVTQKIKFHLQNNEPTPLEWPEGIFQQKWNPQARLR